MKTVKTLDFLFPGSARDSFYAQIAFARMCLDSLGGIYRNARCVAVLEGLPPEGIPDRWRPYFANIETVEANPEGVPNEGWNLQHQRRFDLIRDDADLAVICDADICVMRPFDSVLDKILNAPALCGVLAHYHFPIDGLRGDPDVDWPRIARSVLGRDIPRPHRYLLGRDPDIGAPEAEVDRPRAPFYINYGVLIGTPDMLRRAHARERDLMAPVAAHVGWYWAAQVAFALACEDLQMPLRPMKTRFNYANRPECERLYPEEMKKAVLFHYMYKRNFHGGRIFASEKAFNAFLRSPYDGADQLFRRRVKAVTGGRYPFSPA